MVAYSLGGMLYGERLKAARKFACLTQKELAERSGVTQPTISQLETSEADGSMFTAQFADACKVSALWLATERGEMTAVGYPTHDRKVMAALQVLQELPEYGKDAAIKELVEIKELICHAKAERSNGTS